MEANMFRNVLLINNCIVRADVLLYMMLWVG